MIGFNELASNIEAQGQGYSEEKGYRGTIPEGWRQGRTAYGGLTAGLSLAAAKKQFPDLPPFRSATVNFIGPVTGDPVFISRKLRAGRNVTSVETQGTADGAPVSSCSFIFAAKRPSALTIDCPAPDAPPPAACEPFTPPAAKDFVPGFFNRFDTRLIAGARPVSGANEGYIRTWSRHHDEASRSGIESLLTIGDVLPPAAMPLFRQFGPVSSVNWMFTVLTDEPITEDGWWHIETKLTAAMGGYSSQVMRIWNMQGQFVAEAMQCVAIFI